MGSRPNLPAKLHSVSLTRGWPKGAAAFVDLSEDGPGQYCSWYHLLRNRQYAGAIEDTGRLDDMTVDQWRQVEAEGIQRVIDDEGTNELVNQRDGERRDALTEQEDGEVRGLMNRLLTDYVNGSIDRGQSTGKKPADNWRTLPPPATMWRS